MKYLQTLLIPFSFILIFSSCEMGGKKTEKLILGNWEYSEFFSHNDLKKISADYNTPGMTAEMTMHGSQSFLVGGRYNQDLFATIRVNANGQEIPISFFIQDAGKWEIHDNFILTISEDANVTATNEVTKNLLDSDPSLAAMFTPTKGTSEQVEILDIAEKTMRLKPTEMGGLIITYKKK